MKEEGGNQQRRRKIAGASVAWWPNGRAAMGEQVISNRVAWYGNIGDQSGDDYQAGG